MASLHADGRARPSRQVEDGRMGMVAPGGQPGQRGVSRGAGDSTPRSDTHHAPEPRGTATVPAAPTAERGAGRASSRSPPPPPPPPGQIHMGRGSRQGSPHFFLPSSYFRGSRPLQCLHCLHPKSAVPGPPPQPTPEVWLKLSRVCSEAASCVLPPRPPPPTSNPAPLSPRPGPAAFGTQGFPAGRSAGPGCARRDLL